MELCRENEPHSIKCLRAIESYEGGRAELGKKIGLSKAAIDRWFRERRIASGSILKLIDLCGKKFSADDLIGRFDNGSSN